MPYHSRELAILNDTARRAQIAEDDDVRIVRERLGKGRVEGRLHVGAAAQRSRHAQRKLVDAFSIASGVAATGARAQMTARPCRYIEAD